MRTVLLKLIDLLEILQKRARSSLFRYCTHSNKKTYGGFEICQDCHGKRTHEPAWGEPLVWNGWKKQK